MLTARVSKKFQQYFGNTHTHTHTQEHCYTTPILQHMMQSTFYINAQKRQAPPPLSLSLYIYICVCVIFIYIYYIYIYIYLLLYIYIYAWKKYVCLFGGDAGFNSMPEFSVLGGSLLRLAVTFEHSGEEVGIEILGSWIWAPHAQVVMDKLARGN